MFDGPPTALYRALAAHWATSDPEYCVTLDADRQIAAIERHYALRIPEDFREYLLHAAPRQRNWDFQGTQWWTIGELRNLPDECPDWPQGNPEVDAERDKYLIFSDFLIWCYAWAICCSEGPNRGRIALIGGIPDAFVADSFRAFLRLELTDDLAIHQGPTG